MNNKKNYTQQQLAIIRRKSSEKVNQKTVASTSLDMRLAKIKNRYLFNSSKPTQEHTYAVFEDAESKEIRAIPATHLYVPDEINMSKLHNGLLRKVKFAGYETPSGVENYYHNTNVEGKPIDLKHSDIKIDKTPIPQKQAQIIKAFAKYPRKRQ